MSLTKKITYNTAIQFFGKAIGAILGLATIALITRHLGPAGFGRYTIVLAFLQIFGIMIDFGLQMTTAQMISNKSENESKILGNIMGLRLTSSIIFFSIAPLVALAFPYEPIVKAGIAIGSIIFIFQSLTSTLTGLFQKHLLTQKLVVGEIVGKLIFLTLVALAFWMNWSLLIILSALALSSFVNFLLVYLSAQKIVRIRWSWEGRVWQKIISFSWPIALTIALNLLYFKADTIILSVFQSQAEVGLYGAPYKILEVLIGVIYLFLGLLLPIMTNYSSTKNFKDLKKLMQNGFDVIAIAAAPIVVGFLILGEPIMILLAGESFAVSGQLIKILIIATVAIFFAALFGYAVVALNKQKQMIKYYLINALISLVLYFSLIPTYTYWAAAWITVGTEVFILATAFWVVYREIRFMPKLTVTFKAVAASLAMGLVLGWLGNLFGVQANIFPLIIGGAIAYLIALYALRGIPKDFVFQIFAKDKK